MKCDTLGYKQQGEKRKAMLDVNTQITYRNNNGGHTTGTIVGYDNHLRYIIKQDGAGKFDPHTIVSENLLVK